MDEDVRAFGELVGHRALARDWPGVHALLAPWLRSSLAADDVRQFFEKEYLSILEGSGVADLQYPEYPEPQLGGNSHTNATALREPISWAGGKVRPVPPELSDSNMRYWLKMQLMCSDEQMATLDLDFLCEVWMAVVTTPEGLRVGYWSQGAY